MAKTTVHPRLDDETIDKIDQLSNEEKRSRSNMIEILIDEAIDHRRVTTELLGVGYDRTVVPARTDH